MERRESLKIPQDDLADIYKINKKKTPRLLVGVRKKRIIYMLREREKTVNI